MQSEKKTTKPQQNYTKIRQLLDTGTEFSKFYKCFTADGTVNLEYIKKQFLDQNGDELTTPVKGSLHEQISANTYFIMAMLDLSNINHKLFNEDLFKSSLKDLIKILNKHKNSLDNLDLLNKIPREDNPTMAKSKKYLKFSLDQLMQKDEATMNVIEQHKTTIDRLHKLKNEVELKLQQEIIRYEDIGGKFSDKNRDTSRDEDIIERSKGILLRANNAYTCLTCKSEVKITSGEDDKI